MNRSAYPFRHPLTAREREAVVGKTGMGKSTLLKELARREMAAGACVVAWDPHDEYSELGVETSEVTLGPLTQRATVTELINSPAILDREDLALAIVPEGERGEELAEEFREVCRAVKQTGNLTFIVDEVGEIDRFAELDINRAATTWRKFSIPVVLGAQRMVQIPKTTRTQLSGIVTFLQDDDDDLAALQRRTRDDEFPARVLQLGPGEFIHWRDTRSNPAAQQKRKAR